MSTPATSATTTSNYLPNYYIKTFLETYTPDPKVAEYAFVKDHPKHMGLVAYFPRMFAASTSVGDFALTEGNIVSAGVVSAGQVAITLDQLGDAKAISDLLQATAIDTTTEQIVKNLAVQANNIRDKYALAACYTSANTAKLALYRDGNAGQAVSVGQSWGGFQMYFVDSTLLASNGQAGAYAAEQVTAMGSCGSVLNVMSATALRANIARLKAKNANPIPAAQNAFAFLCHTNTAMKLLADTSITALSIYTDPENYQRKGVVGKYAGALIVEDNNVLVTAAGLTSANLYFSVLLSENALGVTKTGDVETHYYTGGSPTNPLATINTFGWKTLMGTGILNTAGGLIIVSNDD